MIYKDRIFNRSYSGASERRRLIPGAEPKIEGFAVPAANNAKELVVVSAGGGKVKLQAEFSAGTRDTAVFPVLELQECMRGSSKLPGSPESGLQGANLNKSEVFLFYRNRPDLIVVRKTDLRKAIRKQSFV